MQQRLETGRRRSMAAEQSSPRPPDYQFKPTEDSLVLDYLRPFALGYITGAESVINDDPYRVEPGALLAEHQRDSAFFFARKTMAGTRRSRTVGESGRWKTQTSEKQPAVDGGGRVVALFRKTLLSYYDSAGNRSGSSSGYVMYEYELFVDGDGDGRGGGGTHDSVLCHVKKSCREVARSNKRKRESSLQAAGSGAASVLCPCAAPAVIDSSDGLPGSRSLLESASEAPTADGSEDAAFLVLLPSEATSETPTPLDSSDPVATRIFDHLPWELAAVPFATEATANPAATTMFDHLPWETRMFDHLPWELGAADLITMMACTDYYNVYSDEKVWRSTNKIAEEEYFEFSMDSYDSIFY